MRGTRQVGACSADVCIGTYTWAVSGSNDCPAPSFRIVDAPTCQSAAAAAGKTYDGPVADPSYPRGCAWYTSGSSVRLNTITTVGAGSPSAVLLCAWSTAAPTGALCRAPLCRASRAICFGLRNDSEAQ